MHRYPCFLFSLLGRIDFHTGGHGDDTSKRRLMVRFFLRILLYNAADTPLLAVLRGRSSGRTAKSVEGSADVILVTD
jgi:hypothetical protein